MKMHRPLAFLLLWGLVPLASAHGISESDHQAMLAGGPLRYLWSGAMHMVTGYDHLLFLFGVIFFLARFKDIVKYVTAFTIGHSITLVLATYLRITANYYLVDAVIALSVCYKGFDNLDGFRRWMKVEPPHLLGVIFLFGLIHGFGLSARLQQLDLGEEGLLVRILSFNAGVEAGQIAALSVLLVLLAGWRGMASFRKWAGFSNAFLIVLGALLFLMQMHGYLHDRHPDDFGFNEDAHHHIHEDMRAEEERATAKPMSEEKQPAAGFFYGGVSDSLAPASPDTPVIKPAKPKAAHGHSHGEGHHTH